MKNTIIVPLFMYPTNGGERGDWNILVKLKKAYPSVPVIAIVNPSCDQTEPHTGIGKALIGDYAAGIGRLREAGILVLGYVYTGLGSRSLYDVKEEVALWKTRYGVDGIFFDSISFDADMLPYYAELTRYVKLQNMFFSVGSTGLGISVIPDEIINSFDTFIVYGGQYLPKAVDYLQYVKFNADKLGVIALGTTYSENIIKSMAEHIGLIYVSNYKDGAKLSGYLDPLMALFTLVQNPIESRVSLLEQRVTQYEAVIADMRSRLRQVGIGL